MSYYKKTSRRKNVGRTLAVIVAIGSLMLLLLPLGGRASAQRTTRMLPRRTAPPTMQTTPPQRPREDVDWQAIVGGILGGRTQTGPIRPNGEGGGQYNPVRPIPMPTPVPPRRYVVPDYGPYVRPTPEVRIPDNVVETRRVTPAPNPIVSAEPRIPRQPSPLEGRVWEVSVREGRCYAMQFERMIDEIFSGALGSLGKGQEPPAELRDQVQQIREMMSRNAPWREIEPIARALLDKHRSMFSGEWVGRMEYAVQLLLVRDAFQLVGQEPPRGRRPPFSLEVIPTGLIWIVFDPTLAPGTGLWVSEHVLVCGGGEEIYVVQMSVAEALGLPVGIGPPQPNISMEEARELRGAIQIRNREDAPSAVNFVLNGRSPHTLPPGRTHHIPAEQKWTIEFDRGGGTGTARYSLTRGSYEFRIIENRWELMKLKFEVTIDNRQGTQEFSYVVNNEIVSVPPGKTQTHVEDEALVVEFDRGAGPEEPARKNLNKSGTYKVAVNTDDNYLDLFPAEETG